MQPIRKLQWLLVAITVAALAPFLNKAFHIDDPLFLWMAQQVAKHPFDPYGFSVNWAGFPQPMWAEMQNPPLCSYYIAAAASVIGWSEPALHFAFLLWPIMSILGAFALGRRLCTQPLLVAVLVLFSPAFLVSATNVMCDVMLLAFWVWAIECWLAGLETKRFWLFITAALLATAAALTKYFGIAVVPLLAVFTLAREVKAWPRLFFLLLPIAAAVTYDLWSKSKYGHGLFSAAGFYAQNTPMKSSASATTQLLSGLCFLGGCFFAPIFYLRFRGGKSAWLVAAAAAVAAVSFCLAVPLNPQWLLGTNLIAVRLQGALFAAIGAALIALALVDLVRSRDGESLVLALWLIGTFAFATFLNWSITARTLLPLLPAAAILLLRGSGSGAVSQRRSVASYWPVLPVAVISLLVTAADYRHASTAREAARIFKQRFAEEPGTVWFQSHWGFQYYMQQWGATPLNSRDSEIHSGDVMLVPANNTAIVQIDTGRIFPPEETVFPVMPFVSVFGRSSGAGFYTSVRGLVPWAFAHAQPELYYVARFR